MVDHGFEYRPLPDDYDYDEMSDEELMARLDYGRTLMARADAYVAFINSQRSRDSGLEMAGFLDLFHPNMPEDRKRELILEAKRKDEADRRRGYY